MAAVPDTAAWPQAGQSVAAANADDGQAPEQRAYPSHQWPTQGQLTYTKELITVLLLLLALPWLVSNLVKRPGLVLAGLGRKHVDT